MKRIRAHLSYANVAATLALVFAMSGGAIAATGGFSSGGTLRACVNEEGGLKLLKAGGHCGRGRKAVSWNSAGRAGATGAKGATGATGTAGALGKEGAQGKEGPRGPSAAFNTNSGEEFLEFPTTPNENLTVATLNLPAGKYAVVAKVLINNNANTVSGAECELILGAAAIDQGVALIRMEKEGAADRQFAVYSGAGSLDVAGTARLVCKVSTKEGNYQDRVITATQVASVG